MRALVRRSSVPALACLPRGGPAVPDDAAAGAGRGARAPVARGLARRGRSADAGHRRRPDAGLGGLRRDVLAPPFYRELTAALRSGLAGDRRPLLRLVAEATGGGTDAGDPVDYSEGLDAAVACHDYPQLYDMTAPAGGPATAVRRRARPRDPPDPAVYGPFTDPRVRRLRLAGARLVHPLAGRARRQPGRTADAPRRALLRRAGARAQRRARLDHHAGRGRPGRPAVPRRPAGRRAQQLPRDRGGRHRRLRPEPRAHLRAALPRPLARSASLRRAGSSRCARWAVFPRGLSGAAGARQRVAARPAAGRVAALTVADVGTGGGTTTPASASACAAGTGATAATGSPASASTGVELVSGVPVCGTATWDRYGRRPCGVASPARRRRSARPAARALAHASHGRERRARREARRSSGSSHVPRALSFASR